LAPENHVVEELDFDRARGGGELTGDLEVGRAGLRVAAGVVVGDDDAGGGTADGFAENFSRVAEAGGGGAGRGFDALDEAEFGVEAENPEFFDFEPRGVGVEVAGDEVGSVEQGRCAGLLAEYAARELHHGEQLEGFDVADPFEASEIGFAPGEERGEGSGGLEEVGGEREDIVPARAAAQEHGEEFDVAQGGGAEALQALLRTLLNRQCLEPAGGGALGHGWLDES